MKGFFIALEGIDGSGTTTQAGRLAHELRQRFPDRRVVVTAEPSNGVVGQLIRDWLGNRVSLPDDGVALLFAADRLIHYHKTIKPIIEAGGIVISDRYRLSSLVYQSFFSDPVWVRSINEKAPLEDLTILLDVPVTVAMERLKGREKLEKTERLQLQIAVRKRYLEYANHPDVDGLIVTVDGNGDQDQITERVRESSLISWGLSNMNESGNVHT